MKKQQSIFALLFACWLVIGSLCFPAQAVDIPMNTQTISYLSDGSYLVTTITYVALSLGVTDPKTVNTKSGTKSHDYYSSSNELMWTFRVHGTFTYDGSSAKATSADYSYDIYNSTWSNKSASASYSSATATSQGRFSHLLLSVPVTVSLTCSAKGVLS